MTIDPVRGRQAEPVWRSNCSAAWSRKNSRLSRRSISVCPSAVRRSSSTERISEPSWSRWLRLLRLLVVVQLAFDPAGGAVEEVDRRPEQIFEVGFEAGVGQGCNQGVEDVGDGAGDRARFGQWPRVGFVLEGAVAVELEFGEDVVGRG